MTTSHMKIPLHVTGKLHTKIFSLTMYTQLNYKQKDRAFVILFHTAMNKPMDAYHPRLYINDSKSCKNTASCQISTSTFSYKPTYENNCIRHHTKIPPKITLYTFSILRLHTTIRTPLIHSRQTMIILFITNQAKNHRILYYHVCTYHYMARWLASP